MLNDTPGEYIFIRSCIFFLRSIAPISIAYCTLLTLGSLGAYRLPWFIEWIPLAESLFYVLFLVYRKSYLQRPAVHPVLPDKRTRRELVERCIDLIPDHDSYLSKWFLGAKAEDVKKENVKEFFRWAFFNSHEIGAEYDEELDEYVKMLEESIGRKLPPGRGDVKCLRLTLDNMTILHRSLIWYFCVWFVDNLTVLRLLFHGFKLYRMSLANTLAVFPPRLQTFLWTSPSPAPELSYWYRPHKSRTKIPVLFLHGIGIGLYPYGSFLADLSKVHDDGQVGIIAIEIMSISFRITGEAFAKDVICKQILAILDHHGYDEFMLFSHSYGSIITTYLLRDPKISGRIASMVIVDPITVLLHHPDVAYNMTIRQPKTAQEWQLWYFASKDAGVAHTLGRRFFWFESILWKEDLADRRVTVFLSERDLLVNTAEVRKYLLGEVGHSRKSDLDTGSEMLSDEKEEKGRITVVWCHDLDHGQVFEKKKWRRKMLDEPNAPWKRIDGFQHKLLLIKSDNELDNSATVSNLPERKQSPLPCRWSSPDELQEQEVKVASTMISTEQLLEKAAEDGTFESQVSRNPIAFSFYANLMIFRDDWPRVLEDILSRLDSIIETEFPTPTCPSNPSPPPRPASPIPNVEDNVSSQESTSSNKENTPVKPSTPRPPVPSFTQPSNADTQTSTSSAPNGLSNTQSSTYPPHLTKLHNSIRQTLKTSFQSHPPYSIQRLAELILYPKKHYRFLPPYLNALDRTVSVSSDISIFPLPLPQTSQPSTGLLNGSTVHQPKAIPALGSDESLGGALLTPIPWLSPVRDAQAQRVPSANNDRELQRESTEIVDGPNGAGRIETVSVVNGVMTTVFSQAPISNQPANSATSTTQQSTSHPSTEQSLRAEGAVTQGELLRQEQQAGVVPVSPRRLRMSEEEMRIMDADEQEEEETDRPHARGPEEVGVEDTGPQEKPTGAPLDVLHAVGRHRRESSVEREMSPPKDEDSLEVKDEIMKDAASDGEEKEGEKSGLVEDAAVVNNDDAPKLEDTERDEKTES